MKIIALIKLAGLELLASNVGSESLWIQMYYEVNETIFSAIYFGTNILLAAVAFEHYYWPLN